jgi:hypothetical protein
MMLDSTGYAAYDAIEMVTAALACTAITSSWMSPGRDVLGNDHLNSSAEEIAAHVQRIVESGKMEEARDNQVRLVDPQKGIQTGHELHGSAVKFVLVDLVYLDAFSSSTLCDLPA